VQKAFEKSNKRAKPTDKRTNVYCTKNFIGHTHADTRYGYSSPKIHIFIYSIYLTKAGHKMESNCADQSKCLVKNTQRPKKIAGKNQARDLINVA